MDRLDMNLLVALDALLETNSVTLAAERMQTSVPAMSRTLARLRQVLGDPLLVRSGRALVPTPRALELRHQVHGLVEQGRGLLTPRPQFDAGTLRRGFVVRAGDEVRPELTGPLLAAVRREAPGVTLNLVAGSEDDPRALRDGRTDLQAGVIERSDPETVLRRLYGDRLIGVAAADHPLVTEPVTVAAYAAAAHLSVSRQGRVRGAIDDRLALHGRTRRVIGTVPDLTTALLAVRGGTAVCPAPASAVTSLLGPLGLRAFEIPLPLPEVPIGLAWHPRHTADEGHRWLRDLLERLLRAQRAPEARPRRLLRAENRVTVAKAITGAAHDAERIA
ncbi:LysR family transcriptional regulator [Nocardia jiangsuensis]|uniref:LysR family transcriptional regulator n=1 Tax=Nocardia jiangsuensis TaxID=1691563 RepID=A0ABV8DRF1_9NOCA